jgi:hypothetical protein
MLKNCISQVDLLYLARFFQLHRFVLNGRMSVTGKLHRKWSWPNLKQCPSSCLEWWRKASKICSVDRRLIRKVAAQSSSYCHCDTRTSRYGRNDCQRDSIVHWGCMTSSGTWGVLPSELISWSMKVITDLHTSWVQSMLAVLGEEQQLILSCQSVSESKCPRSWTESYWASLIHLNTFRTGTLNI